MTNAEAAQQIFEEIRTYVPAQQVDGPYGIRWQYEHEILTLNYLEELLRVRRVQFLEGRIRPDMELPTFEEEATDNAE